MENVLAEIMVKFSFKKSPTHGGHLQSMSKRLLGIVPMSKFTFINGQAGNHLQTNKRKNKKGLFFYLENAYFKEIISF